MIEQLVKNQIAIKKKKVKTAQTFIHINMYEVSTQNIDDQMSIQYFVNFQ